MKGARITQETNPEANRVWVSMSGQVFGIPCAACNHGPCSRVRNVEKMKEQIRHLNQEIRIQTKLLKEHK